MILNEFPQDYATAMRLLRPLAEAGLADVQYNLGIMYAKGQDVASAQTMLGHMYDVGHGVPQDYVQAHKWINLAAAVTGTTINAEYRDIIAAKMTPAQIAEAQKLAREWKPAKP